MQYRRLGKSGLKVSALSFGSWVTFGNQVFQNEALEMMSLAYDRGINFFDNAEAYANGESEKIMGAALKDLNWRRDSYCVSSKVFWGGEKPTQKGLSRKHITDACHAALMRLQVDYLDLYFCHRPDPETPVEESVRAMTDLVRQGKILYWGTSEWPKEKIIEAYSIAREFNLEPPTMEQPQYNLLARNRVEKEYASLFSDYGMGTTIWSPLASGFLTGKYNTSVPEGSRVNTPGYEWLKERLFSAEGRAAIEKVKELEKLAKTIDTNCTLLSLAWCLANPNVSTVILGASKKEQLETNLKALELVEKLSPDVLNKIDKIFA